MPKEKEDAKILDLNDLNEDEEAPSSKQQNAVYYDVVATDMKGAWSALALPEEIPANIAAQLGLQKGFTGLASPALNPMSMALSHEEIVVGCADGTI